VSRAAATALYRSSCTPGFSSFVRDHPRRVTARKLVRQIQVSFASAPCSLQTREGMVSAQAGDAIITGIAGEHWRVSRARFPQKYRPVPPTVAGEAGAYESLPYQIMAVRMQKEFDVLLADGESRLHGERGDWLVDYGDGSLGVIAPAIFANTYELDQ
jgi:hypothetical protein